MTREMPVTKAIPLTIEGLFRAISESPVGGPFPRIGTLVGPFEVAVPHLCGSPTREIVTYVEPSLGIGNHTIVYNLGLGSSLSLKIRPGLGPKLSLP